MKIIVEVKNIEWDSEEKYPATLQLTLFLQNLPSLSSIKRTEDLVHNFIDQYLLENYGSFQGYGEVEENNDYKEDSNVTNFTVYEIDWEGENDFPKKIIVPINLNELTVNAKETLEILLEEAVGQHLLNEYTSFIGYESINIVPQESFMYLLVANETISYLALSEEAFVEHTEFLKRLHFKMYRDEYNEDDIDFWESFTINNIVEALLCFRDIVKIHDFKELYQIDLENHEFHYMITVPEVTPGLNNHFIFYGVNEEFIFSTEELKEVYTIAHSNVKNLYFSEPGKNSTLPFQLEAREKLQNKDKNDLSKENDEILQDDEIFIMSQNKQHEMENIVLEVEDDTSKVYSVIEVAQFSVECETFEFFKRKADKKIIHDFNFAVRGIIEEMHHCQLTLIIVDFEVEMVNKFMERVEQEFILDQIYSWNIQEDLAKVMQAILQAKRDGFKHLTFYIK